MVLLGCFLFIFMSSAHAAISLNEKWAQNANGYWSLSISPRGSFEAPSYVVNGKCLRVGEYPHYSCGGNWVISVGGMFIECKWVDGGLGITGKAMLEKMQSEYSNTTCTLPKMLLNGSETICIKNYLQGMWSDGWSGVFGLRLYATSGCEGGTAGGGSSIQPPVKPLSCSISDITLAHGTVDYSQLGASEASGSATVSCTRQATVKITIANGGKVNFNSDGSFYSVVSVMGKPGGAQFSVNGSMQVPFVSRLYTVGEETLTGAFNRSAVAVLDIL